MTKFHSGKPVQEVLYGWKEIAQYLGCCTKTARQYAKHETAPLPIKKLPGKVLSSKSLIDKWVFKK